MRPVTKAKRAASLIEVVDAKLTDLDAGGCVQQRHHADERLREDGRVGVDGPAPEKAALLGEAEGPAGEAPSRRWSGAVPYVGSMGTIFLCSYTRAEEGLKA